MRIENVNNYEEFFDVIGKCDGKIELVTTTGDRLNLHSKLSQYVSLVNIFLNGRIHETEIIVHNPVDRERLRTYMVNNG